MSEFFMVRYRRLFYCGADTPVRERLRTSRIRLNDGLDVLTDPVEDLGKAKFVPVHRTIDERVSVQALDLEIEAVAPQENIGGGESDALIAVKESVVVAERLHQRGRFFFHGVVIAGLRTKNGGLNRALIPDAVKTAEHLD